MGLQDLLAERGKTHGNFADNARVAQAIKRLFNQVRLTKFDDVQAEGLDLIVLKLSRILTGSPNNPDNWDDIAGYATRVADELRPRPQQETKWKQPTS